MKSNDNFPINGALLRDAILEKYKSIGAAGRAIGYSHSAFSNPIKRGEITAKLRIAADKLLGIPYEVYASETPVPLEYLKEQPSASCKYCGAERVELSKYEENKFVMRLSMVPKDRSVEANVYFGYDENAPVVISDFFTMSFCPFCGRVL